LFTTSILRDKIVQQAVATVLEAVYEEDFLGFSYGFRPGRGQHDALDALHVGLLRRQVNWVLNAVIAGEPRLPERPLYELRGSIPVACISPWMISPSQDHHPELLTSAGIVAVQASAPEVVFGSAAT
jgi:hypothetical protein